MDYEKLYNEVLGRAKIAYKDTDRHLKASLERIFKESSPELRESEDERISKAIIAWLKATQYVPNEQVETLNSWIAWLEKQGVFSNKYLLDIIVNLCDLLDRIDTFADLQIDNTDPNNPFRKIEDIAQERHKFVKSDGYNLFIENFMITNDKNFEKQGEQKPIIIIPQFKVGDIIKPKPYNEEHLIKDINENGYVLDVDIIIPFKDEDVWEIVEQKPAWSEDDESRICQIIDWLEICKTYNPDQKSVCDISMQIAWLKSIKDRFQLQPKQELSENNEKMISLLIKIFEVNHPNGYFKVNPIGTTNMEAISTKEIVEWLKSLKPQKHWKPSDEQLSSLGRFIEGVYGCVDFTNIKSLYNDLKNL